MTQWRHWQADEPESELGIRVGPGLGRSRVRRRKPDRVPARQRTQRDLTVTQARRAAVATEPRSGRLGLRLTGPRRSRSEFGLAPRRLRLSRLTEAGRAARVTARLLGRMAAPRAWAESIALAGSLRLPVRSRGR